MHSISCMPISSSSSHTFLKHNPNPLLGDVSSKPCLPLKRRPNFTIRALLSSTKESVLREFHERRALKIISGLQNFNKDNIASVVTAADKGGATHVDIACDPELVKLAISLTSCPIPQHFQLQLKQEQGSQNRDPDRKIAGIAIFWAENEPDRNLDRKGASSFRIAEQTRRIVESLQIDDPAKSENPIDKPIYPPITQNFDPFKPI